MKDFKVIAFTYHKTPLDQVGRYHIGPEFRKARLSKIKIEVNVSELLYLSTCNRVEFILLTVEELTPLYLFSFFKAFAPQWNSDEIQLAIEQSQVLSGVEAIRHVFHVAASLDSLVVGEREIITQVRSAFEVSVKDKLCGDSIRLLIRKVIEASKEVFTATPIARNPVSVVSLAYRQLRGLNVKKDARFIIVGAGQTNTNLCKYLYKHGFRNFAVFNRSIENGQLLAQIIGGVAYPLDSLNTYQKGFDVLVTCTSSADYLIDTSLYKHLLQSDKDSKVVIDLAIPNDVDPHIFKKFEVMPILVESLKQLADENRAFRLAALVQCEKIIDKHFDDFHLMFRERIVERAMKDIPQKVKDIRNHATNYVFARELESMDDTSRQVLEKMLTYFEKKYISVPIKMAKEILLDKQ